MNRLQLSHTTVYYQNIKTSRVKNTHPTRFTYVHKSYPPIAQSLLQVIKKMRQKSKYIQSIFLCGSPDISLSRARFRQQAHYLAHCKRLQRLMITFRSLGGGFGMNPFTPFSPNMPKIIQRIPKIRFFRMMGPLTSNNYRKMPKTIKISPMLAEYQNLNELPQGHHGQDYVECAD